MSLRKTFAYASLIASIVLGSCGPSVRYDDGVDAGPCPEGLALCGTECVSLADDRMHCGGCGYECPLDQANACLGGQCACVGELTGTVSDDCDEPTVCIRGTGQCVFPDYGTTETCDEIEGIPCDDPSKVCARGWCTKPDCLNPEVCDGRDNDCDGHTDAYGPLPGDPVPLERDCYNGDPSEIGVGACRAGRQTCYYGSWTPAGQCPGEVLPVPEEGFLACDGVDNDCNACVDDHEDENGALVCGAPDPIATDVAFVVDVSGSMSDDIAAVSTAMGTTVTTYGSASWIRWGIVQVAAPYPELIKVFRPLTDFMTFLAALASIGIDGGVEPTYDAVIAVANDTLASPALGRDPSAKLVIVVFTDEEAQTTTAATEASVCRSVADAGAILVVFTNGAYFPQWDDCALLYPLTNDAAEMTMHLTDLFELTCSI